MKQIHVYFHCPKCRVNWRWPEWLERPPEKDKEEKLCPSCDKVKDRTAAITGSQGAN